MAIVDWAKLLSKDRVKAVGISWSKEEQEAIYVKKIPANYVRQGILTVEDYKKELERDKKVKELPLEKMKKAELVKKAKKLGVLFNEDVTSRGDLILEIKAKSKKG